MSPLTHGDRRLAARAGRGDDAAFAQLAARHRERLVRAARRRLGDRRDDAEDVVQEALLNALRALRAGKRPDNPSSWLMTIVANCCHDHHRSASRRTAVPLLEETDRRPGAADLDPHVRALERARVEGALAAVRALPETQREALVGFELRGQSYEELAREHGWSVPGTKSLLWRARISLAAERDRWAAVLGTPLVAIGHALRGIVEKPAALVGAAHAPEAATYAVVAVLAAGTGGGIVGAGTSERDGAADVERAAASVRTLPTSRPAPASAARPAAVAAPDTAAEVLRACARGRSLAHAERPALLAARRGVPADVEQYSGCGERIRVALAAG